MSELKEHQFCESDEFFREYPGPLSNELRLYYLKSEADKVIAHHKRKRCLAMVEMLEHICPITIRKAKWKGKWHLRWLELADKFKEAK